MGKVIACVNEKGGVAKTTTVKNMAVGLAMEGKKVLAIDLDPSCSLTKSLGLEAEPDVDVATVSDILDKSMSIEPIEPDFAITHHDEGIDLVRCATDLWIVEKALTGAFQREVVLKRYTDDEKELYDYILLDCPAGLGVMVDNALFAADELIIPTPPKYLDVESMQNLFTRIADVRKCLGTARHPSPKPAIAGILFTAVRHSTNVEKQMMARLREMMPTAHFFDTFIPQGRRRRPLRYCRFRAEKRTKAPAAPRRLLFPTKRKDASWGPQ